MKAVWITLITFVLIILLFIFIKLYLVFTTGWDRSPTCLIGKTVLITGANTGIGFYAAQDFAKRGAKVILACRDLFKAEEAKSKIIEASGNPNVVVKIVDLSSLASVRKFALEIKATEDRLDILVNNAGAGFFEHTFTQDNLSLTMQINHFGPFLLTILLIGLLKRSSPSRVVMVSSSLANMAQLNIDDLNAVPSCCFRLIVDYGNTKLCNILIANELARKLKKTGVDVNSLHPGVVQTDFLRHLPSFMQSIARFVIKLLFKTTETGAQTTIYVAVSKEITGTSGAYFVDCKKSKMPRNGNNVELAKKVWEKTEQFVKLTTEEKKVLIN